MPNPPTLEAVLRSLAEATNRCSGCAGIGRVAIPGEDERENCKACNGTGTVPRFRDADGISILRKNCLHRRTKDGVCQSFAPCPGYLPLTESDDLYACFWAAVDAMQWDVNIDRDEASVGCVLKRRHDQQTLADELEPLGSELVAMYRALYAAVQQEGKA